MHTSTIHTMNSDTRVLLVSSATVKENLGLVKRGSLSFLSRMETVSDMDALRGDCDTS